MASIKLQGDNSGTLTIEAPSDAGNNTITLPATSSTLATQNALGVRNLIINGDMRIAQRGTSVSGIVGGGASGIYQTVDRFKTYMYNGSPSGQSGTWTQTQDTDVPSGQGFSYSLKMQCTTAQASLHTDAYARITQAFENQMVQHLKYGTSTAEKITLSFWVKSNKTGTYIVELNGPGRICNSYTIDTADTWEKKIWIVDANQISTIANDNLSGLYLQFWIVAGSTYTSGTLPTTWSNSTTSADRAVGQVNLADSTSNYINITGVQLEVGDTATPFEHRPYDMELLRCQRYFCSSFPQGVAPANGLDISIATTFSAYDNTTGWSPQMFFPVSMRAAPTMTAYKDNAGSTDGQWTTYDSGYTSLTSTTLSTSDKTTGFYCNGSRSSAFSAHNSYLLRGNFTADAEL